MLKVLCGWQNGEGKLLSDEHEQVRASPFDKLRKPSMREAAGCKDNPYRGKPWLSAINPSW